MVQEGGSIMSIEYICSDYGMCGNIRINWPAQALQSIKENITNSRKLLVTPDLEGVYLQRVAEQPLFDILNKLECKKVIDFDDMLFKLYNESLPSYNHAAKEIDIEDTTKVLKDNLQYIDKLTVTTNFLKTAIEDNFNYNKIEVIPNMLPRWMFHFDRKKNIKKDITNPTILYAGSSTHYSLNDTGDFSKPIIEFIRNNIDKINFVIIGNIPFFFQDIADKIMNISYVNVLSYPNLLHSINADFIISPLKENVFNKCKSNLKYLEACAVGSVLIASDFDDSPYKCIDERCKIGKYMTSKHIDKMFWELCNKENYNEVLNKQYDYINEMWLENNLNKYQNLFSEKAVGI